jgi:hypothetical protein
MLHARCIAREPLVVGQLEPSRERLIQPVVPDGQHHLAVGRAEDLVRRDVRKRGTVFARLVARERVGHVVARERERGLEERDLDHVTLAIGQRREHAEGRPPRGGVVDERDTDAHRRPAGLARHAEDPGERLHQRVVAGQFAERAGPVRADPAVDPRADIVRADAEPLGRARPKALDEHVDVGRMAQERRAAPLRLQIEDNGTLPGVCREEHRGTPLTCLVTARPFHLDDVRAERREQLRARRSRERRREVDDADALERPERHARKGTVTA